MASISTSSPRMRVAAVVAACLGLDGAELKPDSLRQLLSKDKVPAEAHRQVFADALEQHGLSGVLQQLGEKQVPHQYVAHMLWFPDLLPCIQALDYRNTFDSNCGAAEVCCPAP